MAITKRSRQSGVFHPRALGAKFDGINDDSIPIQDAIDAASAAGGGTVLLERGTALLSSTLTLANNVHLRGAGMDVSVLKVANSADVAAVTGSAVSDVMVSDLTIDGNKSNQSAATAHGIDLSGAVSRVVVQRVFAHDCKGSGVRANCTSGTRVLVKDSYCESNDLRGVHYLALSKSSVANCFCNSNTLDGIDIDGFCQDVVVQGNQCWSNTRNGVFVEEDCNDITVVGNVCNSNSGHGININENTSGQITESITVSGNVCEANGDCGIRVVANVSGATVRDVVVANNVCMENDQDAGGLAGIHVGEAVGATLTSVIVSGNRCGDRQGTKTQDYGISISANVADVLVFGNICKDNATGSIDDSSAGGATLASNLT